MSAAPVTPEPIKELRAKAIADGKINPKTGKRCCDWCGKDINRMWISYQWFNYVRRDKWLDYICLRCWGKIPGMKKEHKLTGERA